MSRGGPDTDPLYPERTEADLIAAYRANPAGPHDPAVQRLLNRLNADPAARGVALVTLVPSSKWAIATVPAERSQPIVIDHDHPFDDVAAAEWEIFRRRWHLHTGRWPD